MAKKITFGVLAALAAFVLIILVLAATKPDSISIERSLVMRATPADVLPYASDYAKFVTWIPWTELDPDQTMTYSDPKAGVGAWYTWEGNDEVGKGRMEVLSVAPEKVVHKLEFIEPFESTAESAVVMRPVGEDQVEVTWGYSQTDVGFTTKLMMVFMDMDSMMGPDFEKGLATLKPLVEADAAAR